MYCKLIVYFLLLSLFAIVSADVYSCYKEKEAVLSRTFGQLLAIRYLRISTIVWFI